MDSYVLDIPQMHSLPSWTKNAHMKESWSHRMVPSTKILLLHCISSEPFRSLPECILFRNMHLSIISELAVNILFQVECADLETDHPRQKCSLPFCYVWLSADGFHLCQDSLAKLHTEYHFDHYNSSFLFTFFKMIVHDFDFEQLFSLRFINCLPW